MRFSPYLAIPRHVSAPDIFNRPPCDQSIEELDVADLELMVDFTVFGEEDCIDAIGYQNIYGGHTSDIIGTVSQLDEITWCAAWCWNADTKEGAFVPFVPGGELLQNIREMVSEILAGKMPIGLWRKSFH